MRINPFSTRGAAAQSHSMGTLPVSSRTSAPVSSGDSYHKHEGFIPDYVLQEMERSAVARGWSSQDVQSIRQARKDLQMEPVMNDPEFLRAKKAYERVYLNGEDPANLSFQDQMALSKFFDWLKKFFDWIFGKKSPTPTPPKAPTPSDNGTGARYVHSAENTSTLRKSLKRGEGAAATGDKDVDAAYDYAGKLRQFMKDVLGINSIDKKGMSLHQTVHYGKNYANAFWNGQEMAYGDGDGKAFGHFAQDATVIHHELGHGMVQHHNKNGGLNYYGESGALNESFADINAVTMLQYMSDTSVGASTRDMWLIGAKCMIPYTDNNGVKQYPALRSFLDEKAYKDHPLMGTDRQPKYMKDKYTGNGDNGGVHINSGITNYAFYLASKAIGGKVWETTYQIWYKALEGVPSNCTFNQWALATVDAAVKMAQGNTAIKKGDVQKLVDTWKTVGVLTEKDQTKLERIYQKHGFDPAAAVQAA